MDYETTAFYVEGDTLDACAGHANPDGTYHYHSTPGCLQEQAMVLYKATNKDHSPQLGWSYVSLYLFNVSAGIISCMNLYYIVIV